MFIRIGGSRSCSHVVGSSCVWRVSVGGQEYRWCIQDSHCPILDAVNPGNCLAGILLKYIHHIVWITLLGQTHLAIGLKPLYSFFYSHES